MTIKTDSEFPPDDSLCKVLLVSIAHHEFALPIEEIVTTSQRSELMKAPNLPPIFSGFLRFNKQLYPIIRLDTLFQVKSASYYPYTRAVIIRTTTAHGEFKTFGLLVDEVIGEYEIETIYLHKVYGHFLLNCVEHNVEICDQFYPVISPAGLLEEIETYCLQQFSHPLDTSHTKPERKV